MKYLIRDVNSYKSQELESFFKNIRFKKRKRINNYSNNERKKQAIVGEILLKELLEKYYNIKYNTCIIEESKSGKPYITNYNIYFNISHKDNLVVCAVSYSNIGVDIEKIRDIDLNTINIFATTTEKKYILEKKEDILKRLFKIYTLKEAYLKMNGDSITNIKNIDISKIKKEKLTIKTVNKNDYIISIIKKTDN